MVERLWNPRTVAMETKGSLGIAGLQSSSRFNERPFLKGVRQRVVRQTTQSPLLVSECAGVCAHTYVSIHHAHKYTKNVWSHPYTERLPPAV